MTSKAGFLKTAINLINFWPDEQTNKPHIVNRRSKSGYITADPTDIESMRSNC